jgi:RIO kinase 1
MRIPDSLVALVDEGIVEQVLRPLMSGKEAQVYLLRAGSTERVAKVYKGSQDRTFRQRAEYTEGRAVRNTRDQRALAKRSRYGREQDEAAWRSSEVDVIYRLHAAGVRVPTPYQFIDGVLIMELITDADGNPAPRLGDVQLERESAVQIYEELLRYVVQMLCTGVVHGDLSEFNVLLGPDGPVIIDFPQAVNASSNQNARKLLLRDVANLHRFVSRFAPDLRPLPYAEEMWALYQRGELTPDVRLTGRYRAAENKVDTAGLLGLVEEAERDERRRRASLGLDMRGTSDGRGPQRSNSGGAAQPIAARSSQQRVQQAQPARPQPAQQRVAQAQPVRPPPQRIPQPQAARPTQQRVQQTQPARPPQPAQQRIQQPQAARPPQPAQQRVQAARTQRSAQHQVVAERPAAPVHGAASAATKASKRRRRRRRRGGANGGPDVSSASVAAKLKRED